ncbi:hypothetical protein cypCar_00003892 [Cyprinus carpio]|nr:hypothetical protein cypCar_00003892 [Cyprinus carpio]
MIVKKASRGKNTGRNVTPIFKGLGRNTVEAFNEVASFLSLKPMDATKTEKISTKYDEGTASLGEDVMVNTVKNSTLLDHSHAQDLALQQPPNLSSILEKEKPIKCRKVTFSDIVSIRNVSSHSKRGKTDQQDSGAKPVQASGSVSVESRDISSWPVTFFDFANEDNLCLRGLQSKQADL